ncbi:hypothetical protein GIB67_015758 [Kingdonia uniflora]|uniref:Uncharacterized protein n=1 Tax=Kingdonia uniflora TaxID=39325 RepID=A0A7J7NUE3_9MAGN|nr:hypothetical protein GIB67_015758 [Kingdonia uniflora]
MGCCYSRVEREEMVSRCKARRRYMKHFVKARQAFSAAHIMYLRSLRGTGSALLQFASAETTNRSYHNIHHHHHHLPPLIPSPPPVTPTPTPLPPPPPPPMSPSSDNWTSVTESPARAPPPPPPPPPPSSWDFWDPFGHFASSKSVTEEEWDEEATTRSTMTMSEAPGTTTVSASIAPPPSIVSVSTLSKDTTSELALVVSRNSKDLVEIIKELDEYFLKAADVGNHVSALLEASSSSFSNQRTTCKVYNCGKSLSPLTWTWGSTSKSSSSYGSMSHEMFCADAGGVEGAVHSRHCLTVEKLYAWEKKLFEEVKNAESIKIEHEKRESQLRKQEARGSDYLKTEKNKKEIEKLESRMMVASQAIETTSTEIIRVREVELYPQLLDLVKGSVI